MASHKDYMDLKRKKLNEQNQDQCHLLGNVRSYNASNFFKGVSVYVTGFTEPSSSVLKEIILKNGGNFQMFYRKTDVTHIIATNLPDFKVKLWKNELIITPQWIVDCDLSQTKLPEAKYILFRKSENLRDMILEKHTVSKKETSAAKNIPKTTSSNFVDEFYSNSRLHHLSTSVSELRFLVSKLQHRYHPMYTPMNRPITNALIVHIDIDCFFVSISLKSKPHLRGLPVCVTHAKPNEKVDSYAEISSCSYEAREFGIHNGMFLGKALTLCPNLIAVPYEFAEYNVASQELYRILVEKTPFVEVVSCDEAFMDIVDLVDACDEENLEIFVNELRTEIFNFIGCTVSAGIGPNKLVARMATRKGKPNGQYHCLGNERIMDFIKQQPIEHLPGIGHSLAQKLYAKGFEICSALCSLTKTDLSEILGTKTGEMIHNYCRGNDERELIIKHERKSISVEINYGIRVDTNEEFELFLLNLCRELEKRMKNENVVGSLITLKLKKRSENAAIEPIKYMGHGICENISKSLHLTSTSNSATVMHSKVMSLVASIALTPSDIRGVGVQMSKLNVIESNEVNSHQSKMSIISQHSKKLKIYKCEVPEFLGCKDFEKVKEILKVWTRSDEPMQIDVDQVDMYFNNLIKYGNISLVEKILRDLRRHFIIRNTPEWNAVFNAILQNVQLQIHSEFNGILSVKNL